MGHLSLQPAAAPPPPAPCAPPPAPAAPAAPPPPAPRPGCATKGPRAAAAAAAAARGARMVLVRRRHLVLPVFGSVRNRGIAFCFRGPLPSVGSPRAPGRGLEPRAAGWRGWGGRSGHTRGRGASGGFSPLPSGGTPSVEVAAPAGAFAVKRVLANSVPSSPAPFFILCGGRGSPSHSPFPQYLAPGDRDGERYMTVRARLCLWCVSRTTLCDFFFFLRCMCVSCHLCSCFSII